jgi:heme-degrading monooxygenase HmoA
MIGRFWRGWATHQHAQAYEELFRTSILPGLQRIDGFAGAYVLRKDAGEEVELMTITLFESLEAIRVFAGNEPMLAHVTPEARRLLTHFEHTATHYEVALAP